MTIGHIVVRLMEEGDIDQAHAMTQVLNWPHTYRDWLQIVSLGYSLVMEVEETVIGTACLIPQGKYASVGLVVVSDKYRSQGLGRRIMNSIMLCSEPNTHLYLTATEMSKTLYQQLGFAEYATIEQYQGVIETKNMIQIHPLKEGIIRVMNKDDTDTIKKLMNVSTGMDRSKIGDMLLKESVETLVIEVNEEIVGVALSRAFGRGFCVGPVIAKNSCNALALISHHLVQYVHTFVRLDISNQHHEITDMLSHWGLKKVDTASQMVKGIVPNPESEFVQFSLAAQALG